MLELMGEREWPIDIGEGLCCVIQPRCRMICRYNIYSSGLLSYAM